VCYTPVGQKRFPVKKFIDEDGFDQTKPGDEKRFLEARNGDNLMNAFQCDLCHFRNVMGRNPRIEIWQDREILEYIRRANLDAFWSREPTTVASNLREARKMESKVADRLGIPSITRPMGPYPLEDSFGMSAAIAVLDRSLDPGIHEEFVQWDTFRRVRSTVTNINQAGVGGMNDVVGAYERERVWISGSPTHHFWFSRFMAGLHKRVGEVRKQDRPVTIDELHEIETLLERSWKGAKVRRAQRRVAEMGVWFIVGFCTGIRGEEMLLLDYAGTRKGVEKLRTGHQDFFKLVVLGRSKGNQLSGAEFGIPCVAITEGTGLQPGKWIIRLIRLLEVQGVKEGPLMRRVLRPGKLVEFQDDFFRVIEMVQATTNLIEDDVFVRDEFGIERSTRRGVTIHAKNMDVGEEVITANNRWRREANSASGASRLDMIEVYTVLDALMPLVLRFSKPL
jgi:hypothetical protein